MVRKVVFLFHVIPLLHTCLSETKVITLSKIGFNFKLNLKASKTVGGRGW
jgi:SpoU rRNA methylase family enzyme